VPAADDDAKVAYTSTVPPDPPKDDSFVTHVLEGKRFDDHAVPVEVLPELTAYRQLVLAVAREVFFERNPTRKRVPKGFDDGFQLVLRGIGEGCAVLPLERVSSVPPDSQQLPLLGRPDEFEAARDLIIETIDAMVRGEKPPASFPESALPLFNKFGVTLRADEHIVVRGPQRNSAVYDRATRKRLVLLRDQVYEDEVDVVGAVVQYDRHRMLFEVVVDGRRIQGKLDGLAEDALSVIRTALVVDPEENLSVWIVGRGAFDHSDTLMHFVSITDVSYAEDEALRQALDVGARLSTLAKLADGWFEGDGQALNGAGLRWLADLLTQIIEDYGLPHPYLYPSPEGEVVAEWPFPAAEVSADFDLAGRSAFVVGTHLRTGATAELTLHFKSPDAMARLFDFVAKFGPDGLAAKKP
jgi:hypothetical protein